MKTVLRRVRAAATGAAFATAAWLLSGIPLGAAAQTIPLDVRNLTDHPGTIHVYIWGQDANGTNYYVTDTSGTLSTFTPSSTWTSVGYSMGKRKKFTVQIPMLIGARVYFSLDKPMKVTVDSSGAPSTPVGWDKTDENYKTLFDWFEYTWEDVTPPSNFSTSLNGNLTQVDMVGLPMLVRLKGLDATNNAVTTAAGFGKANSRERFIKMMRNAPAPWHRLVVAPNAKYPYRVISPYNGMKLGVFPPNHLDHYINQVYSKYGRTPLRATTTGPTAKFTGRTSASGLVFTQTGTPANTVTFVKPTSMQVYQGYLGTPSNSGGSLATEAGELARYLQASFLRSTILENANISACPGTSAYYKHDPIDLYSKHMHTVAYKHLAYGFGWDDVCNQASDYTVFDPERVMVKILPLKTK